MKNESEKSMYALAVNGKEEPPLIIGQTFESKEKAEEAVGPTQQDFEFSPLTVREIIPGKEYLYAPMSFEELH